MQEPDNGASGAKEEPQGRGSQTGSSALPVKDPKRLLLPARILVLLSLGLSAVGVVSNVLEIQFLNKLDTGAFASEPEIMAAAEANDQRQLFVFIPYAVVVVLSFIFVGRWIYFSSKNLRAFGAVGLTIRPGWAVGWYFVPIANLWKPYQAMKEIWQASSGPPDWTRWQIPGLMPAWWSLWLISTIVDRVAFRMARNAETIADFQLATSLSIASGALFVANCAVFVVLISRISRLQIDAMEHKSTLAVFGP